MGFLGGLFGGGDASGSGIGNSTTKQTTTYNEKYANVADYARYSHVGSVVDLKGVVGKTPSIYRCSTVGLSVGHSISHPV